MENSHTRSVEEIKCCERMKRDEEAEHYIEFVENVYGPYRAKAYTDCLLRYMELKKNEVWLDAGAGVGRMTLRIAPHVKSIVCLDHSPASLKVLRRSAEESGLSNIEVYESDLCRYCDKVDHFDGILCNEVLQHIPSHPERLRGLIRLNKALRPGGKFLINVIRWRGSETESKEGYWGEHGEIYRNYFTPDEVDSLLREAGFVNIHLRGIDIVPQRVSRFISGKWTILDQALSRIPLSRHWGNNIVAFGTK
jgi:2-polyprenyl-3-methyl-5-hydroxy-6-metoxy-1,4-benzoquinol methylase